MILGSLGLAPVFQSLEVRPSFYLGELLSSCFRHPAVQVGGELPGRVSVTPPTFNEPRLAAACLPHHSTEPPQRSARRRLPRGSCSAGGSMKRPSSSPLGEVLFNMPGITIMNE
ncbi:hypothetical protein HPB51_012685 [Rhipicephalus microplus]|uniref:Uncharacterized protein n=1 Tax=Rhipicephalus microplus TaxID=6941 RepID=A0A9J6D518_RHIMP|nr:hypothetical protein HPB51_012685 [Rhipicephalus microplus]